MSFTITEARNELYNKNVLHLLQQTNSRLRGLVRVEEGVVGNRMYAERVAATAAVRKTTRHGDTPLVGVEHSKRSNTMDDYEWADLLDKQDKVRTITDPVGAYVRAAHMAFNRSIDDVIFENMIGSAYDGEGGGTEVVLPSGQKIAHGSAGLTLAKLKAGKKLFRANHVPDEDELYMAITAEQEEDLFGIAEVINADYNTMRVLANGKIDTFMGFKFVHSERVTLDSDGNRACPMWSRSAIKLAIGIDINTLVSLRPDKSNATQVYGCITLGAVRTEEEKVVEVACTE